MDWTNKVVLLIGGTGSFGTAFLHKLFEKNVKAIRVYSRDEFKQSVILSQHKDKGNLSGLIGDIRDKDRLTRAMEEVNIVIHCAALKQVQSCEYNPLEAIKTNIIGSMNVIDTALDNKVEKVLAISTDKAVNPLNLYGATKMCMERLISTGNSYRGVHKRTKFCSVRYGNVIASRGTIVPIWRELIRRGEVVPITNSRATRFWIGMKEANEFVASCIELMDFMDGGEIFVPRIPSVNIIDVFRALADGPAQFTVIGNRIGDKLHETLISKEEILHTVGINNKYVIYPEEPHYFYRRPKGCECDYKEGYRSDNNKRFLGVKEIKETLVDNQ